MELQSRKQNVNEKMSDAELLRLYLDQRSEDAFAMIGKRYARLVYGVCLRETGRPTLAEDASQEALLLLSRKASSLRDRNDLAGWLFLAARFTCKNMLKQERRTRLLEERAFQDRIEQEKLNASRSGSSQMSEWDEIEPHFNDILFRLKPADRQAVLLRFVQEESLKEVGDRLGISENTARMRVNRAVDKIRVFLERAGVAVTAAALIAVLEERSASASTSILSGAIAKIASEAVKNGKGGASTPLSKISQETWAQITRKKTLLSMSLGASAILILSGGYSILRNARDLIGGSEQRQLFKGLSGNWQGNLEYADDRSGEHFAYPSRVAISNSDGYDKLRMAATFEGSSAEDITVLTRAANGKLTAENQGDNRSHSLLSVGELIREGGGDRFVFYGYDAGRNVETRIQIDWKLNQLQIQEDYRTPYWALASVLAPVSRLAYPNVTMFKGSPSEYKFRNRFTLTRK